METRYPAPAGLLQGSLTSRAQLIEAASRFPGHYSCNRGVGPLACQAHHLPRPAQLFQKLPCASTYININMSMVVRNDSP